MRKGIKWIIALVGAAIFVLLLRCFAFTSYYIPSKGMESSLLCGDRILVNKWSYGLRAPLLSQFPYQRWKERVVERGDIVVFNNPANPSTVIDKKEVFITRCIGLPGDTLIVDSVFTQSPINLSALYDHDYFFYYPIDKEEVLDSLINRFAINTEAVIDIDSVYQVRTLPWEVYHQLELNMEGERWIHPFTPGVPTCIRPLVIPAKGQTLKVYPWNRTLLMNTILLHEGHQAEVKNDTLFVDGLPTTEFTFTKNYYWTVSNNSINLSDSRLFGFLPHDHLIGKAEYIWFSKTPNTGIFEGYRWERFFNKIQ